MIATLTQCVVYGPTIVKSFVLGEFPKAGTITEMHIVLEYDIDSRQCQLFLAGKNTVEETPEQIKILNADDSYDYDVMMDRLIIGDYLKRYPKMFLETEDYTPDQHDSSFCDEWSDD